MSASFELSVALTEEDVRAALRDIAGKLESFAPGDLKPERAFIPFVQCRRTVRCTYDAERFVHDPIAHAEAHKWHQASYNQWAARDEYWRSKNPAPKSPDPRKSMKFEKDVAGTVSISGIFGPYCAVSAIHADDGAAPALPASAPWQRMCAQALGRLAPADWKPIEALAALGAPQITMDAVAAALMQEIDKRVAAAIDSDARIDWDRSLRGLRKEPYQFSDVEDTCVFVPFHIFRSSSDPSDVVLVEGCTGNTWTSFRAKPKAAPVPPSPAPAESRVTAPPADKTPAAPRPAPARLSSAGRAAMFVIAALLAGVIVMQISQRALSERTAPTSNAPAPVARAEVVEQSINSIVQNGSYASACSTEARAYAAEAGALQLTSARNDLVTIVEGLVARGSYDCMQDYLSSLGMIDDPRWSTFVYGYNPSSRSSAFSPSAPKAKSLMRREPGHLGWISVFSKMAIEINCQGSVHLGCDSVWGGPVTLIAPDSPHGDRIRIFLDGLSDCNLFCPGKAQLEEEAFSVSQIGPDRFILTAQLSTRSGYGEPMQHLGQAQFDIRATGAWTPFPWQIWDVTVLP